MKKFLIVVCIIGVIIFLGYIGTKMDFSGVKSNETNNTSNSNVVTGKNNTSTSNNLANNTTNQTNNVVNNTATNQTENKTENITENKTVNNTTENTANNTTAPVSTVEQNTVSDEDKAKSIAQQTYGTSERVYFKVEQIQGNGVYIISVRDSETTGALAWYTVDAKNNTIK